MAFPVGPFRRVPQGGGAKLPAFLPLFIDHLELYLDSRLGVGSTADGALLSTWEDLSGHSPTRDAVSQSASSFVDPTYWSTTASQLTPNGLPSVQWGLTTASPGNILASAGIFPWPDITPRGYTFYYYGRVLGKTTPTYPAVNQGWFGPTNKIATFAGQNLFDSGTGPAPGRSVGVVDTAGGGNPHQFSQRSLIDNQWRLHTIIWPTPFNNTVPCRYFIDAVEQAQVAGPTNFDLGGGIGTVAYTLGNLWNGNTVVRGNQGYCCWYSDTHSQARINLFKVWTDLFFGLT